MVHKITVNPKGIQIFFHVGHDYYKQQRPEKNSQAQSPLISKLSFPIPDKNSSEIHRPHQKTQVLEKFLKVRCSNTLTIGADDGTRTCDLRITNALLYQLSYVGAVFEYTHAGGEFKYAERRCRALFVSRTLSPARADRFGLNTLEATTMVRARSSVESALSSGLMPIRIIE